MAHVLTEVDAFTASITVPDAGDARSDAAEVVADIGQRLANRTLNLTNRVNTKAGLADANVFTQTNHFNVDVNADHDINAGHDVTSVRHIVAGNNFKAVNDYLYTAPKARTSLVALNTGIVVGAAIPLSFSGANASAYCASWAGGQFVVWRILIPNTSVLQGALVIHSQTTVDPNQFNLLKRSGAVFDILGGTTAAPTTASLLSGGAINGPASTGIYTAALLPASTLNIDNSANEYWITWAQTGGHAGDGVNAIELLWSDNGPRTDHS